MDKNKGELFELTAWERFVRWFIAVDKFDFFMACVIVLVFSIVIFVVCGILFGIATSCHSAECKIDGYEQCVADHPQSQDICYELHIKGD